MEMEEWKWKNGNGRMEMEEWKWKNGNGRMATGAQLKPRSCGRGAAALRLLRQSRQLAHGRLPLRLLDPQDFSRDQASGPRFWSREVRISWYRICFLLESILVGEPSQLKQG